MIHPEDIEFHHSADAGHRYAETNYFCFTLPEQGLAVSAYAVFRKGIGVMGADVTIFGGLVRDRAECLYIDAQQHLPAPDKLSDYGTANGLYVKVSDPRHYHVEYEGFDGVAFNVDFEGIMEPFDIHDPEHSPKAKPQASVAERHSGSGLGSGYGGHFDLTCRVTGTLDIRGKRYAVDCVETMDHSWGQRPEIGINSMGWMHAHFGPDLAIHWIAAFDPTAPADRQWTLAHGYVVENGLVYGLTDLQLRSSFIDRIPVGMELVATDRRGKVWKATGVSTIGAPWICYIATEAYCMVVRWTLDDGRIGYGMCMQNESMQSLNRRIGRAALLGDAPARRP